ncbi:hypothetical protein JCM10207_003464 [Rhodosporidiobolus poonsookiae]
MLFRSLLALPLLALSAAAAASGKAAAVDPANEFVETVASWPKSNPFARVTNGQPTLLNLKLTNHHKAGEDVVVTGVKGEFREAGGKERALRKTAPLPLRAVTVAAGQSSPAIPYRFHSENKIGEVGLRVWVEWKDAKNKAHEYLAFDDIVNVVEPPSSWFDLELLSVYAILLALLAGGGSLVYSSFFAPSPSKKSKRSAKSTGIVATSDVVDGNLVKEAEEDRDAWIPAHHKKAKGKKGGYASATSGDESEGARRRR